MSEYDSFEDYVFSLSDERFSFLVQAADKRLDSQLYGVTSFEEAALKYERKPVCPDCGSLSNHEDGYTPAGHKRYRCQDCSSSFPLLSDTIFNSAKISLHKLMSYIQLMSFNVPLQLLCEILSISSNTAELWRKKIFETVNGYQDHLKLYGTIWIDETYLSDYSILHDPLEKRKRGLSKNLICIVTAVDSYKNMVAIISGHGKPSSKRIKDVLTFFALSITGVVLPCPSPASYIIKKEELLWQKTKQWKIMILKRLPEGISSRTIQDSMK